MQYQIEVIEFIRMLVDEQSLCVVIILHDINLAAQYADHIIALKKGEICHSGNVKSTIQEIVLQEIFNVEVSFLVHPKTGRRVAVI